MNVLKRDIGLLHRVSSEIYRIQTMDVVIIGVSNSEISLQNYLVSELILNTSSRVIMNQRYLISIEYYCAFYYLSSLNGFMLLWTPSLISNDMIQY